MKTKTPAELSCDVYNQKVLIFRGWKEQDFRKYMMKKYNVEMVFSNALAVTSHILNDHNNFFLIWTSKEAEKDKSIIEIGRAHV